MSFPSYSAFSIAVASFVAVAVAILLFPRSDKPALKVIPSPRMTLLPRLTSEQSSALPYPPNLLPGSRDVDTPYGSMRVYEWGPELGRKVIMISGDTTPAPILSPIAKVLVLNGLRVMVVDTWGRGYSDAPTGIPYDSRLFMTQVFFAVSSSSISWTGTSSGGFSMIGYSLGGSIAMSFAATFPYLVNSVILLASGGLIRSLPAGYDSAFFRHRSLVPTIYLRHLVATILGISTNRRKPDVRSKPVTTDNLDLHALWQWQFDEHQGFVHAFIDTTQNGPIQAQHKDWKKALDIISGHSTGVSSTNLPSRLYDTKILVVFGDSDGIVIGDEVREELMGMMPQRERIVFRTVPGGHGFPIPSGEAVAKHILDFWKLGK